MRRTLSCGQGRPGAWLLRPTALAFLVLLAAAAPTMGCRESGPHSAASGSAPTTTAPLSSAPLAFGSRAEAVARADADVLDATRLNGVAATERLWRAARLREGLYRLEHRAVDALEAGEVLRLIEKRGGQPACEAALVRGLLDAEVAGSAARLADAVGAFQQEAGPCGERVRRALELTTAIRPVGGWADPAHAAGATSAFAPASSAVPVASVDALPSVSPSNPTPSRPLPPIEAAGPPMLVAVERFAAKDAARVVLTLNKSVRHTVGELAAGGGLGPRVYIDLAAGFQGDRQLDSEGLLTRVRLGRRDGGTRVVLDLATPASARVLVLPEPHRVVVDVLRGTLASHNKGKPAVRRVVLDPGHGGHDPGAVGPSGLAEKDVTLDVAHRAAPLIARELGIVTLLTRDVDAYVSLPERTARANAFSADLFVSIHCNASPSGQGSGVMTFVLDRARDAEASSVAARENAASEAASEQLAKAIAGVLGRDSAAHSSRFASLLQRSAVASLTPEQPSLDRGVKQAGFFVLAGAHMPAVLFESSFISDPTEERRLASPAYRQKIADAIVNAIRAYRQGL